MMFTHYSFSQSIKTPFLRIDTNITYVISDEIERSDTARVYITFVDTTFDTHSVKCGPAYMVTTYRTWSINKHFLNSRKEPISNNYIVWDYRIRK